MIGPIVYIFIRDDKPIYIGLSKHGLARALHGGHHLRKKINFKTYTLTAISCSTEKIAFELETNLIGILNPKLNKRKNPSFFMDNRYS